METRESEPFLSLIRWYIDLRSFSSPTTSLPCLSMLDPSDQQRVTRYHHHSDKQMCLASNLLKYLFVHQKCKIPWSKVTIGRTAAPYHRPCFVMPGGPADGMSASPKIDFNVSHQARVVVLAGAVLLPPHCHGAGVAGPSARADRSEQALLLSKGSAGEVKEPQVGIDITCVNEESRRGGSADVTTAKGLNQYVDIFSEVLSRKELETIKNAVPPPLPSSSISSLQTLSPDVPQTFPTDSTPIPRISCSDSEIQATDYSDPKEETALVAHRLKLFKTYWALKEAYLKMTGEGLLAPWIRDLEFEHVHVPTPPPSLSSNPAARDRRDMFSLSSSPPPQPAPLSASHTPHSSPSQSPSLWGPAYTDVEVYLHGQKIENVRIEVVAFDSDYLVATAARGPGIGPEGPKSETQGLKHSSVGISRDKNRTGPSASDSRATDRVDGGGRNSVGAGSQTEEAQEAEESEDRYVRNQSFAVEDMRSHMHIQGKKTMADSWAPMQCIDIDRDIVPCAMGWCHCLQNTK